jgi:hypothetical protein
MMRLAPVLLAFTIVFSAQVSASLEDHYSALVSFVKSEVEWSYFDVMTETQELVVLDEASLEFTRLSTPEVRYSVSGTVIEFDEDFGPSYGTVTCEITLTQFNGRWTRDFFKSSCQCDAQFICGEREGRVY